MIRLYRPLRAAAVAGVAVPVAAMTHTSGTAPISTSTHAAGLTTEGGASTPPCVVAVAVPHPRVRRLYKDFLFLARSHPTFAFAVCREKIKLGFHRNKDIVIYSSHAGTGDWDGALGGESHGGTAAPICDGDDADEEAEQPAALEAQRRCPPYTPAFAKALAWGRYHKRELEVLIHIHKFRAMKKRYDWPEDDPKQ